MIFETVKIEEKFFNFSHPKTYTYLSIAIGLISVVILYLNNEFLNLNFIDTLFLPLAILSFIVFFITNFFTLFSKEDIQVEKVGNIKITPDAFIFDREIVPFEDVLSIDFNFGDFEGKSKNAHSSTEPMFSKGVDNFIKISTHQKNYKKQVWLRSKRELEVAYQFLSTQIVNNKFINVKPKKLISIFRPDFRKTEDARNFIAKKIKQRAVNTTEGLLMMNYASDKEAKELRKKYSL